MREHMRHNKAEAFFTHMVGHGEVKDAHNSNSRYK